jgi:protein-disulfide isomerase
MEEKSNDKWTVPLSIVVAGLFIAGAIYLNGKMEPRAKSPTDAVRINQNVDSNVIKDVMRPIDENDHFLGSSKARIVIVEYSDTECPFCKVFHKTMQLIMNEYGKKEQVAWVYRHFPIAEIHNKAIKEAEALECAGELGANNKFWEYTNKLYEKTPSNNNLEESELSNIASEVGLNIKNFQTCLNSNQFNERVKADLINAQELGALGTPYSILIDTKNNEYYPIEGAFPYLDLKRIIDLVLES